MKKFILFDFDGVISDSFDVAFDVQKKICPDLTEDAYRKRFNGNINNWEDPANRHTDRCRHDIDFFDEYVPRMKEEVKIVPGMLETILELEKDYALIIVSSTITSPIKDFLGKYNLSDHFVQIMGNDVHKSKVEKIKMVFEKYNTKAENCVFVTDTLGDMYEAEKAGVGVVGVAWGFHTQQTLLKGKPFNLVNKPDELLTAVENYFIEIDRI